MICIISFSYSVYTLCGVVFVFCLFVFLVAFLLMIDNTERVSLNFLIYSSFEWPVSWWLLASFTSGVIVGYGFSFFSSLKKEKPLVSAVRDDLSKREKD